jgi:hypothetical protein
LVSHIEGGKEAGVFENRMLRKISGPRRNDVTMAGTEYIIISFIMCTPSQALYTYE